MLLEGGLPWTGARKDLRPGGVRGTVSDSLVVAAAFARVGFVPPASREARGWGPTQRPALDFLTQECVTAARTRGNAPGPDLNTAIYPDPNMCGSRGQLYLQIRTR